MPLTQKSALIVGAGPAGLMAAEVLAEAGVRVTVLERMPSPARKMLMAGRGGLNLTNAEALPEFLARYDSGGEGLDVLRAAVRSYPPSRLVRWAEDNGAEPFVGTSGRVFPREMKAAPLLRSWLQRLSLLGVTVETRREWRGFDASGALLVGDAKGKIDSRTADVVILATGGASWPRLGSDGRGLAILADEGLPLQPLAPSNAGVVVAWTSHMQAHAGTPLKRIVVRVGSAEAMGEAMVTRQGLEGGVIYALNGPLRRMLRDGTRQIQIDLRPDEGIDDIAERLKPHLADSKTSLNGILRKAARLTPAAIALVREPHQGHPPRDPWLLADAIKNVTLDVQRLAGLERAISTAGGIGLAALDARLMVRERPGLFLAGEMLDWDAPTGGYLLQMCFATGHRAAVGALQWLREKPVSGGLGTDAPDAHATTDQMP